MGLSSLVDATITSGGFEIKKPNKAIFLACLKQLDVQPSKCAFVGDDFKADMGPAIELGMKAIWKAGTTPSKVAFSSNDLTEVHAFLRGMA